MDKKRYWIAGMDNPFISNMSYTSWVDMLEKLQWRGTFIGLRGLIIAIIVQAARDLFSHNKGIRESAFEYFRSDWFKKHLEYLDLSDELLPPWFNKLEYYHKSDKMDGIIRRVERELKKRRRKRSENAKDQS